MDDIRIDVRDHYAKIAESGNGGGCGCGSSCCAPRGKGQDSARADTGFASERLGYSATDLSAIPGESDMGLGCGNPTAIAELHAGETVVDLGSGGGIDCFLAARKVGPDGKVIGVDMTPQMIDRARAAARKGSYGNVEFRLGEIENLPVPDASADAIVSNCVINLSPDKPRVFKEAWRVLKPGGRLMVSDIMLKEPLPEKVRRNVELWAGCVSGAMLKEEYLAAVRAAGFSTVEVRAERSAGDLIDEAEKSRLSADGADMGQEEIARIAGSVVSVQLFAVK